MPSRRASEQASGSMPDRVGRTRASVVPSMPSMTERAASSTSAVSACLMTSPVVVCHWSARLGPAAARMPTSRAAFATPDTDGEPASTTDVNPARSIDAITGATTADTTSSGTRAASIPAIAGITVAGRPPPENMPSVRAAEYGRPAPRKAPKCTCASMNPGQTTLPVASSLSRGVQDVSMSEAGSTATMTPSAMAIAYPDKRPADESRARISAPATTRSQLFGAIMRPRVAIQRTCRGCLTHPVAPESQRPDRFG